MLIYQSPTEFAARSDPAQRQQFLAAFVPYMKAMQDAGIVVGGAGLELPATATTIRQRGDERRVQDGPFADTKEQLGGLFILDLPDLDAALEWAARCPIGVAIEVRPCTQVSTHVSTPVN
jgi:hypothetical protein